MTAKKNAVEELSIWKQTYVTLAFEQNFVCVCVFSFFVPF